MQKIKIMFHDDWEINGDGSGDPYKLMFDPAKINLDICDKYNAKYTLFAEFGQQLAMLESPIKKHQKYAQEWENILRDAIKRGHDVQLHYHPQWINAYYKKEEWVLDFSKWALSSLDEDEIYINLKKGKDYLEKLLKPVNKNYKIVAFRAGGWFNQPSRKIYNTLVKLDIKSEVSVRHGFKKDMGDIGKIDFTNSPINRAYWYADIDDFSKESIEKEEVIEIPTYSKQINTNLPYFLIKNRPSTLFYYFSIFLKSIFRQSSIAPPIIKSGVNNSIYGNFGLLHYKNLIDLIDSFSANIVSNQTALEYVPLTMLAHSKSFNSHDNFETLLKELNKYENIEYISTKNMISEIIDGKH